MTGGKLVCEQPWLPFTCIFAFPSFIFVVVYRYVLYITMPMATESDGITVRCRIRAWIYSLYFLQYVQFLLFLFCFIPSTIAAPSSHKGTPRLELNNCSFILSLFSLGKIKRYGKDLELSFRLAIVERIFGMPAPVMLLWPRAYHRTEWMNHITHGKLFILFDGLAFTCLFTELGSELVEEGQHFTVKSP